MLIDSTRSERYVTLKILKAEVSRDSNGVRILFRLAQSELKSPGWEHILKLLDYFEHEGLNGTHVCLVMPFMTADVQSQKCRFKQNMC